MEKEFRVLNLEINKEDFTGLETLIAELSEVKIANVSGFSFISNLSDVSGDIFLLDPESHISQYLLNNPEELKTINLSEFNKGIIDLSEGKRVAYYHIDYMERKSELLPKFTYPDFIYSLDDPKMILADYYYKNKLTDNDDDFGEDIEKAINKYRTEIDNGLNNRYIAWSYFNLAECLLRIRDFEGAKDNFLKSAKQDSKLSPDAYFALSCIKIRLYENAENELKKSVEGYEQLRNEYSKYARSILDCYNTDYQILETFRLSGEKTDAQIIGNVEDGFYSPAQTGISFSEIKNFIKRELRYTKLTESLNGFFKIEVAFIKEFPYKYISHCEISGFNYAELKGIINKIYNSIPPNLK